MSLLNETSIRQQLIAANFQPSVGLHLLPTVDSTNRYLKELPYRFPIEVCCAEMQTQGRGRFNRPWFSPYAENIYCSIRFTLNAHVSDLSALSLLVGISMMRVLEQAQITNDIRLKWPNDLLWQDKKLCGILIESTQTHDDTLGVVIGIGLNVNSDPSDTSWIQAQNKPWCSLFEITKQTLDRNRLIASMVIHLEQHISQFITHGFEPFLESWQKWDYLYGKTIEIGHAGQSIRGTAMGINVQGQLMMVDHTQSVHYCSSGETTIVIS
ncbi:MAG: biotin--[acetyl-CoA-carboxylase] ligase [Legionella sp.]|nr:MAG: biotin--[acetyl-CoA-carboxylase] ligase [Legionella sp.]